jgi:tetratricopeptide (TPR) repeat protein
MDQPNVEGPGGPDYRPGVPTFGEIVERSLALLERRRRVSHVALRLEFSLDDETFAALRDELVDVLGAATYDGRIFTACNGPAPTAQQPLAADSPAAGEEPRDPVTVLLCDLAETPALEALDPNDRAIVTARFHAICGEVAARLRGDVKPWVSDGVAIFFGHPRPQDDDALRAVRCGWEILRTLAVASEVISREFGLRVSARMGVATGLAGDRDDPASAFGDTSRAAGRVQDAGEPGQLLVDGPTHELTEAHFRFAAAGADDDLHAVSGPLAPGAGARHAPTPLVGRSGERALLQALAERAAAGKRSAVLIRGEAGIGKTRLVGALAQSAAESLGMVALHCATSSHHRGSALHPLLSGLRRHWELDGADASARLAERARALPGDRAVALLADMLGVALPEGTEPLPMTSPRRRRREALSILAEALRAEARRAPLLLVVEDMHWADPTTVELIATLLEGPRELSLMLVLTARTDFVAPPSSALQRIELGRLDADETRRVVELVAERGTLPEGVAPELATRAGGSPLLAEELTRTVLATQDMGADVASTLYGCLMARLDRDSVARSVARLAATIGREFDLTLLEAVGGIERSALDWGLERLVEEQVIVAAGTGGYEFRHTLLQEAARSSLPKESLREHNLRIARTLLASYPHVAAAEPERVARHLEYGGEIVAAVAYWQQAGMQALAQHALAEAAAHFERGLQLTARTADGEERRGAELSLRILAAQTQAALLGWNAIPAVAHFERAEMLARDLPGSPKLFGAMLSLVTYRLVAGRTELAFKLARKQIAVADAAHDRELVMQAECEAGSALVQLGRAREAFPHLARAIELYDPVAHGGQAERYGRNPAAAALAHRGLALACRDDRAGARDAIAQSASILRADRHPFSQAWVGCIAAAAALICGEREVVLRESAMATSIATEEGFDDWLAQASILQGWARIQAGEHEAGIEQCTRAAESWRPSRAVMLRPFLHGLVGDALARGGKLGPALESLSEALAWSARGEKWCEPELHRMRAELLLGAGDRRGALRSAQSAVALARRSRANGWERRAVATLARVTGKPAVA